MIRMRAGRWGHVCECKGSILHTHFKCPAKDCHCGRAAPRKGKSGKGSYARDWPKNKQAYSKPEYCKKLIYEGVPIGRQGEACGGRLISKANGTKYCIKCKYRVVV